MTENQKLQLNAPITTDEALLALKSMPPGKAPGLDGTIFPTENYLNPSEKETNKITCAKPNSLI